MIDPVAVVAKPLEKSYHSAVENDKQGDRRDIFPLGGGVVPNQPMPNLARRGPDGRGLADPGDSSGNKLFPLPGIHSGERTGRDSGFSVFYRLFERFAPSEAGEEPPGTCSYGTS